LDDTGNGIAEALQGRSSYSVGHLTERPDVGLRRHCLGAASFRCRAMRRWAGRVRTWMRSRRQVPATRSPTTLQAGRPGHTTMHRTGRTGRRRAERRHSRCAPSRVRKAAPSSPADGASSAARASASSLRLPDYVTIDFSYSLPFAGEIIQVGGNITYSRSGHIFVSPEAGLGIPGAIGSVRGGVAS
jgi:hypothetical protein